MQSSKPASKPPCFPASGVPLLIPGGREIRDRQPIAFGVPLPKGIAADGSRFAVYDGNDRPWITQSRTLARWPDGSIRWLEVVCIGQQSTGGASSARLWLLKEEVSPSQDDSDGPGPNVEKVGSRIVVKAPNAAFEIGVGEKSLLLENLESSGRWLSEFGCRLRVTDAMGRTETPRIEAARVVEVGPVRLSIEVTGKLGKRTGLRFIGRISFYPSNELIRLQITLQNPHRAKHSGGYWDLGDPGSAFVRDVSVEIESKADHHRRIRWIEQPEGATASSRGASLEIYQDSSGGDFWDSPNHVNRHGRIPVSYRGYTVRERNGATAGARANPVVAIEWRSKSVAVALEEFWQQFPSAIEVEGSRLMVRMLPRQFDDLHEIQAGEHNTRVVWIQLRHECSDPCDQLLWVHQPVHVLAQPAWIATSGAIPFLPSPESQKRREYRDLLLAALEGDSSFFAKRERIDEYGWRHYGDVWADHEQAYAKDPKPVISHYNNQYDLLYGLLVQYLTTGDLRWWELADPLARHLVDIDIYHTNRDKAAYNGGLFWHTAHYLDAQLCTHRSMSRAMTGKGLPAPGGGPGAQHNYSTGLLLYHYLTGSDRARDTVIGLADWVVAMDDGRQHPFGVLSNAPTGEASRTTQGHSHGPGRAAGNSVNSLVDGWLVTDNDAYLRMAEAIIRRSIHPRDQIESRDLLNAEMSWSYTVFLQSLARVLEVLGHRADLIDLRRYTRAALLHYARWMTANERFYLDEPDELEYPTETWAAQELRKGTTLWLAARWTTGPEWAELRRRGTEILDRSWDSLMRFDSRTSTRPLALVLQQGYLEDYLGSNPSTHQGYVHLGSQEGDFGDPIRFVDQREYLRGLRRTPLRILKSVPCIVRPGRWIQVIRRTWFLERIRRLAEYLFNR